MRKYRKQKISWEKNDEKPTKVNKSDQGTKTPQRNYKKSANNKKNQQNNTGKKDDKKMREKKQQERAIKNKNTKANKK